MLVLLVQQLHCEEHWCGGNNPGLQITGDLLSLIVSEPSFLSSKWGHAYLTNQNLKKKRKKEKLKERRREKEKQGFFFVCVCVSFSFKLCTVGQGEWWFWAVFQASVKWSGSQNCTDFFPPALIYSWVTLGKSLHLLEGCLFCLHYIGQKWIMWPCLEPITSFMVTVSFLKTPRMLRT